MVEPAEPPDIVHAVVAAAIRCCRGAAEAARKDQHERMTTVEFHGTQIPITTPESTLAGRRAAFWNACADDIDAAFRTTTASIAGPVTS